MFQKNIKLSAHSNYKIGGFASHFFASKNISEIVAALSLWRKLGNERVFILGGGTNLLIDDMGFNGLIIKPCMIDITVVGNTLRVGSGISMPELLDVAAERGLSGLEWAGGLPGTLGGAIRGNAGAFGGEIKDVVVAVRSLDIRGNNPKLRERSHDECRFGYRDSIFKQRDGEEIIIDATVALRLGHKRAIREAIDEKIAYRMARHPMEYPSIGSIFKNVDVRLLPTGMQAQFLRVIKSDPFPVVPVAYLLDASGLKGVTCGGAMFAVKHPNFIVNVLQASSNDVSQLIALAKATVSKKFGILLEEEIIYVH